jgi:hypothetical protein
VDTGREWASSPTVRARRLTSATFADFEKL